MSTLFSALSQRLVGLLLFGLVFYWMFFREPPRAPIRINQTLGICGKVIQRADSRGYQLYFGTPWVPYNFDDFANRQLSPNNNLGYYLQAGDSVCKAVNSRVLRLKRGGQTSIWTLEPAPPAAPQ